MATKGLESLEQVRAFVESGGGFDFVVLDRASRNDFVWRVLVKFECGSLGKTDKGLVKRFLGRATGVSRAQPVRQHTETGQILDQLGGAPARPFVRRCRAADAALLAEVDGAWGGGGAALRAGDAGDRGAPLKMSERW